MTLLEKLQYQLDQVSLPPFASWTLMEFKGWVCGLIMWVNDILYPLPEFEVRFPQLSPSDFGDFPMETKNGKYLYDYSDGDMNIGDQCLHQSLYVAYQIRKANSIHKAQRYISNHVTDYLRHKGNDVYLLRGIDDTNAILKTDISGDQLAGFLWAYHQWRKFGSRHDGLVYEDINTLTHLMTGISDNGYKLTDYHTGKPSMFGFFNPSIFAVNGRCVTVLAGLAMAGLHLDVDILANKYGYIHMLENPSIYLGQKRSWFSDNICFLSLLILHAYTIDDEIRSKTLTGIRNILRRNKWNTWLWALALDEGIIKKAEFPEETIQYFRSFSVKTLEGWNSVYYPLGMQRTDFHWQRNPFGHETGGDRKFGGLPFHYVKYLLDNNL